MIRNNIILTEPAPESWNSLCERPAASLEDLESIVAPILLDVQLHGDEAVRKYAATFDKFEGEDLCIGLKDIEASSALLEPALRDAIDIAYANIRKFHEAQIESVSVIETMPGVRCWRKPVGIQKVGLYIPGGTAPLFSTMLMLGIPAMIAGCEEVIVCSPANADGKLHPALLYAASLIGLEKVYRIGGVQAIAAMAYGTETIPKVFKIFGPGNQYVTLAKQLVSRTGTSIDMPAGPSEVLVYADETADPSFVAADLLSQAEHGIDSQVVLVASAETVVKKILVEIDLQIENLPRKDIANEALVNSRFIVLENINTALDFINMYAPEHLILSTDQADKIAEQVMNAGSVFLGHYTPESAGDYASGTNHTLPTNGYATTYSGVSIDSFVKKITFQQISREGLKRIGPAVEQMAMAEGLDAHKNAVSLRLGKISTDEK